MKLVKFLAVLVASAGVVALVLVYAPSASGQRATPYDRHVRQMSLLPGGAAEIGAAVRDGDKGVVVEDVRPDSPAAKAGVKPGDVVVDFDGERVRSARQFTRLVGESAPDRPVKMTVQRDGKRTGVEVTPASRSADFDFDADRLRERLPDVEDLVGRIPYAFDLELGGSRVRLGVSVQELTDQLATYFGAKGGVLVASVADDSAAAKAGLKAGDVITAIDGAPVRTRADLTRGLRSADGDVTLTVVRDRKEMTLKAKVEGRARSTRVRP